MSVPAFVPGRPAAAAHAALQQSLVALELAQQCAVLWFGDIMRRRLYRELGYSSINQYAQRALGFSKTRCGDFVKLASRLDALPEVRASVARGEIGYTKAREIVKVATPKTQRAWLEAASGSRRELEREVARARRSALTNPNQGELLPAPAPVAAEVPVRFAVDLTPEQEARREALWERLRRLSGVPADRGEVLLEALAALVDEREAGVESPVKKAPRGAPPFQLHVHRCPECEKTTVPTTQGDLVVSRADKGRFACDARVSAPDQRNKASIPPRTRREVLARDKHRCRAPGCGRTRFLEVHHIEPRARSGTNKPENLITLCGTCHRLWHEHGGWRRASDRDASGPPT